jgi:deoxyribose-phosphate aldolase
MMRDVEVLCSEASTHQFATVCVQPVHVTFCKVALSGSGVGVCSVIGFPLGASLAQTKAVEAEQVVQAGADEIDIVAYLPALLEIEVDRTADELGAVVAAAQAVRQDIGIKVILETALLMADVSLAVAEERIAAAAEAVGRAGGHYLKTSTGFHATGGATVEAVRLLVKHAGGLKVKASGGIRTRSDAQIMLDAGADRLGCSASVRIVSG